jgi:hypothetical protein
MVRIGPLSTEQRDVLTQMRRRASGRVAWRRQGALLRARIPAHEERGAVSERKPVCSAGLRGKAARADGFCQGSSWPMARLLDADR